MLEYGNIGVLMHHPMLHPSIIPVFQSLSLLTLDKVEGFNLEQEPTLRVGKEPAPCLQE